jgi:RNA polymerase sigma-70 factor (ECF subfamily)
VLKIVPTLPGQPGAEPAVDPLAALARRAVAGERDAIRQLLASVGPSMLRAIRKILGGASADVEDTAQEAVEGLLEALPRFRGHCTVLHFACRVGILTALAKRRRMELRQQWMVHLPDPDDLEAEAAPAGAPADPAVARRRSEALRLLLDDLPPAQAEVLVMQAALGFTVQEIAGALGRPVETVRSRLRLAKQALRDRIRASSDLAEILDGGASS